MFRVEDVSEEIYFPKKYGSRLAILSDRAELGLRFAGKHFEKMTREFLENPDNKEAVIQLALELTDEMEGHARKTNDRFRESPDEEITKYTGYLRDYFLLHLKSYMLAFEKDPEFKARVLNYQNSAEASSD